MKAINLLVMVVFNLGVLLVAACPLQCFAQQQNFTVNSWTNVLGGTWESTNWSAGVLPGPGQGIELNNSGSKVVIMSGDTATNYPSTLQIESLLVSAPDSGTTNEILMQDVGLDNPLVVGPTEGPGDSFTVSSYGVRSYFLITSSALIVHGDLVIADDGIFIGETSSQITFEGLILAGQFSPALFNFTNSVLMGGSEDIGWALQTGEMNQQGGTNVFTDYLSIKNVSQYVLNGGRVVGPILSLSDGGTFENYGGICIISNTFILDNGTWQENGSGAQFGQLQLGSGTNSTIQFPTNACILQFADSSSFTWSNAGVLTIVGWNGSLSGGGTNQLIFGSNTNALTSWQLSQIRFANPAGLSAGTYTATILTNGEVVPGNTPVFDGSAAPFFTGEASLGSQWYYLASSNGFFGYYSLQYFPYVYHLDMGFEYYIDAGNPNHGAYFYDFSDGAFCYTEPGTFPFIYDFNLNAWLYYSPLSGSPGRYTSKPRWFYNFSTQAWINHL
jgi:hypothetical protein